MTKAIFGIGSTVALSLVLALSPADGSKAVQGGAHSHHGPNLINLASKGNGRHLLHSHSSGHRAHVHVKNKKISGRLHVDHPKGKAVSTKVLRKGAKGKKKADSFEFHRPGHPVTVDLDDHPVQVAMAEPVAAEPQLGGIMFGFAYRNDNLNVWVIFWFPQGDVDTGSTPVDEDQ